jgi:hypothetical protein
MKIFCAIGVAAVAVMLVGCGGGPQLQLAPAPLQRSAALSRLGQLPEGLMALHPDHDPSWMAPEAATQDLLYISNYYTDAVFVYSYPEDKLVGTLTGFMEPAGICTDKKGDVFIANNDGESIVEYKHGGKSPIATLSDPGVYPSNCSVDPTTGNLAVASPLAPSSGPGNIAIFPHAKGSATLYYDPKIAYPYFAGYDDKGNLFIDGVNEPSLAFAFGELPKGKKTFSNIALKGGTIYFPGKILWDGKYVTVGDQECGAVYPHTTCIYQTTGAGGKIVGSTLLTGSGDIVDLWIYDNTVIAPDFEGTAANEVLFYKYPAGGKPTKTLEKGFDEPIGAAVSVAQ